MSSRAHRPFDIAQRERRNASCSAWFANREIAGSRAASTGHACKFRSVRHHPPDVMSVASESAPRSFAVATRSENFTRLVGVHAGDRCSPRRLGIGEVLDHILPEPGFVIKARNGKATAGSQPVGIIDDPARHMQALERAVAAPMVLELGALMPTNFRIPAHGAVLR